MIKLFAFLSSAVENLGEAAKNFGDELVELGHALGELGKKMKPESMLSKMNKRELVEISGTEIQNILKALRYAGPACIALSEFVVPVAKRRKVQTEDRTNLFFSRPLLMTSDN